MIKDLNRKESTNSNRFKFRTIPTSSSSTISHLNLLHQKKSLKSKNLIKSNSLQNSKVLKSNQTNLKTAKIKSKSNPPNHHSVIISSNLKNQKITSFKFEERIPIDLLEKIFQFLPDKYGFPPIFRSRHTSYGFHHHPISSINLIPSNSNFPLYSTQIENFNESEGYHWLDPPLFVRLVNKRWAQVGLNIFLNHISIYNISQLESINKLASLKPNLGSTIRTLVINFSIHQSITQKQFLLFNQREKFKRLLSKLTNLRSLTIKGISPAVLFPTRLEVHKLFLPISILHLAIEFRSEEDSPLLNSIFNQQHMRQTNRNQPQQAAVISYHDPIELHAAELNLFLVCLPNLKSLHLSHFHSHSHRPLSRYMLGKDQIKKSDMANLQNRSLRSLILTDCDLSVSDARFLANRFVKLESLTFSQLFINSNSILALNTLLDHDDNNDEFVDGLAHSLEFLKVSLEDFKFNSSSSRDQKLNLSHLKNLKELSLKTASEVHLDGLNSLKELEIDRKLINQVWKMMKDKSIDESNLKRLESIKILGELQLDKKALDDDQEELIKSLDRLEFQKECWKQGINWN